MATVTRRPHPDVTVLHRVPYQVYVHLTNVWANRHLRMSYHDGTLEIVSPHRRQHEKPSRRISFLITAVADQLGLIYEGTAGTTFRKSGSGRYGGKGKEPDQSFYIANQARLPDDREVDLDAGDPPPDLWLEVDNRVSSKGRLPAYAAMGVPEVWRYRSGRKSLQFLQLVGDSYEAIDESLALPGLTLPLALEALALGDNLRESLWLIELRAWAARTFPR